MWDTQLKLVGGVDVQLHSYLTSVLDAGECSTLRPGRLTL